MRFFLVVVDPERRGITDATRCVYESIPRARGLRLAWQGAGGISALTAQDDDTVEPLVATYGDHGAVGIARLDNRGELERWTDSRHTDLTDLELVLRVIASTGLTHVPDILGDFAFVTWNPRSVFAATDALGVKKLYYAKQDGRIVFASRAEALACGDRYNAEFLADQVAICQSPPTSTAFDGVERLPAGTLGIAKDGRLQMREYWSPDRFDMVSCTPEMRREAPRILRNLLAESVRLRLSGNGDTWAHLSGGLDSSSIVCMAQWLVEQGVAPHGIAGAITYIDAQHTEADEREYTSAVVERWPVRHECVIDPPLWLDEAVPPPRLDQPNGVLPWYPREDRVCRIVRAAGGRVLLAGFGSDELLTGNMLFFADWIARGRLRAAVLEMARWTTIGRISFWQLAHQNVVRPLMPRSLWRGTSDAGALLPWVSESAARRYGLHERHFYRTMLAGRRGHQYHGITVTGTRAMMASLDAAATGDVLDVRYPFLYRPLVEFALRAPPELCAVPQQRKWVLREAMRGILPDLVRTRIGKGSAIASASRSAAVDRSLLEPLVQAPMLADLGVVDASRLRAAFDEAPRQAEGGDGRNLSVDLQETLAIEAWLQVRSGQWPPGGRQFYKGGCL